MSNFNQYLIVALVVMSGTACFEITEPDVKMPGSGDSDGSCKEAAEECDCSIDDMKERVYRFTELEVVKPSKLGPTLNGLWNWELSNYLLNVLFVVEEAEKSNGNEDEGGFSNLRFTVGPGWRSPADGLELGKVEDNDIDNLCLLDDELNVDVELSSVDKTECMFMNFESKALYFHLGHKENPLMCAPLLNPTNTTPLHNLKIIFSLNRDCTEIVDGFLDGCMPQESVNRICMCGLTGLCTRNGIEEEAVFPDELSEGGFERSDLTKYCVSACGENNDETGQGWSSYRGTMDFSKIEPNCTAENGKPGYQLAASFKAVDVSEKYSSDKSVCEAD